MSETAGTFRIEAVIDGARQVWEVQAFTYGEAEDQYYDVATRDSDELIAIDPV